MESNTLRKADEIINGERQDQYGSPEDSFMKISLYWTAYLSNKCDKAVEINEKDVALMMTLFKIGRMQGMAFKHDNAVDACGYLAIFNDRLNEEEEPEKEIHPSQKEWAEDEEIIYCTPPPYPAFYSDGFSPCERVEVKDIHEQ